MKKLILNTLLVATTMLANSVTVEVTDILNKTGKVYIGLYNTADEFTVVSKSYMGTIEDIDAKSMTYVFKDVPDGTYAISVFHDENQNGVHDKNFFGIPSEGYGFSNNIRPIFRSANFDESKFELKSDLKFIVNMGY